MSESQIETDLTIDCVFQAANFLHEKGIYPSTRNVRKQLGDRGSLATISKHLKSWMKNKQMEGDLDAANISPEIQRAVAATIRKQIEQTRASAAEEMNNILEERVELYRTLENRDLEIEMLKTHIRKLDISCTQAHAQSRLHEVEAVESKTREKDKDKRIEELIQSLAVANTKLESVNVLEGRISELQSKIEALNARLHESQLCWKAAEVSLAAAERRAGESEYWLKRYFDLQLPASSVTSQNEANDNENENIKSP